MTRVLVIGGAGVFGSRLAEGLLRAGFEVVVGGRDAARAHAQADRLQARFPDIIVGIAVMDSTTVTSAELTATGADLVADAAGPFQGTERIVARAAIAAGLHYVDLADGRAFVAEFGRLDTDAKTAGVVALSGCSSTPALSHAALDHLTEGWRDIVSVEAAISPGARAPRGLSVMRAILSWLGRPVRVFIDGGWTMRAGWSGLYLRDFAGAGRRMVSLCETPDLDLLVQRYRPRDRALFLAGLEPGVAHAGAWLLAYGVRLTGVNPVPLAGLLVRISTLVSRWGSDRGAMRVTAHGVDAGGQSVHAIWRLIAEPGEGPVTPSLPALAAIKAIARGEVASGARPCVGVLSLEAIVAETAVHDIVTKTVVERAALFARALGSAFDTLPASLRALHETPGRSLWRGQARTTGASGPLAAMVAGLFGFPPGREECPVEVSVEASADRAVWRRRIGGHAFRSVLSRPAEGGRVTERFGLLTIRLVLSVQPERLIYDVEGWCLGPVPLPRGLAPRTRTHETVDDEGRFVFDVEISAPWIGRLVRYRGWLMRVEH